MRVCWLLCLLLVSSLAEAFSWSDLWLTPDQQGLRLLQQKKYQQAQDLFENKEWAASAAYKAGDYPKSAEWYKQSKDYYNLGNALAQAKRYKQALKAYDKALAVNPADAEATFNRKLVEQLLKEQQQKKKSDKNQQKQDKDKQNKDDQQQDDQKNDQKNDQGNPDQQKHDQSMKDKKDQENTEKKSDSQGKKAEEKKDQKNEQDKPKKDQARKTKQSEADREKQQAKEQWLQLVPDDPAGLMRAKFLRDHLRRERGWNQ